MTVHLQLHSAFAVTESFRLLLDQRFLITILITKRFTQRVGIFYSAGAYRSKSLTASIRQQCFEHYALQVVIVFYFILLETTMAAAENEVFCTSLALTNL